VNKLTIHQVHPSPSKSCISPAGQMVHFLRQTPSSGVSQCGGAQESQHLGAAPRHATQGISGTSRSRSEQLLIGMGQGAKATLLTGERREEGNQEGNQVRHKTHGKTMSQIGSNWIKLGRIVQNCVHLSAFHFEAWLILTSYYAF
jgi:hypothetical protein